MASRKEKLDHLEKHFHYEGKMLRHTYERICHIQDQFEWNAFLEAFCVHARLLMDFLQNEGDSRNFKASDYVPGYPTQQK